MVQTEHISTYWGGKMAIGHTQIKSMIIEFAESPHLPDDIQGDMLIAGYFGHIVDRLEWEIDGAGHRLKNMPPLLRSSHRAFRPVDIRVGPDGAIYIADWFNPIIGHYQASLRHPDRDKTHGRIWRVTATGRPLAEAPDFSTMNAAELCEQLKSDWRYVRYQAKRQLADLPEKEVIPVMEKWIAGLDPNHSEIEHHLFEALGVFESHEVVNRALLQQLLAAKDYRTRAYATRVAGRWSDRLERPLTILEASVQDEHPRVRLEAVVACSDIQSAESMVVAAKATNRQMDRFIDFALSQTSHALAPHWLPALTNGQIQFEKPANLTFVLKSYGGEDVTGQVRKLLADESLDPASITSLMGVLVGTGTPQDLRWVLDRAEDLPSVLDTMIEDHGVRGLSPVGDLATSLKRMIASDDAKVQARAIRLASAWKVEALAPQIQTILGDANQPVVLRSAAIVAHGQLRGKKAIDDLLTAVNDPVPSLRFNALTALCDLDFPKAAAAANQLLREAESDAEVRQIVTPFLGRQNGGAVLANALKSDSKAITPELATRIRGVLGAAGRFDPALDQVLRPAAEKDAVGLPEHSEAYVRTLSAEVKQHGNAANGAKVYASPALSCVACHKMGDQGGILGPELTAVGAGVPVELMIEAILWPKRQIKEGYTATSITTKDAKTISGYVQTEDKQRLVIRDAATGATQTISTKQVANRHDAGTLMPPGLTAGLSRSDLRDLIRYLADQKGK